MTTTSEKRARVKAALDRLSTAVRDHDTEIRLYQSALPDNAGLLVIHEERHAEVDAALTALREELDR